MRKWRYHTFARPGRFRAGRQQQRTNLTYVAFVSDDADLNRHLPRVVIGRTSILLVRDFQELFNAAPETIYLVRSESGWVTEPVLREIFGLLAEVLHQRRPDHAYVLAFDCASQHMQPSLLTLLRRRGIYPLIVPAKMTWLLQPLDVYCFRYFQGKAAQAFLRHLQPKAGCDHDAVVLTRALRRHPGHNSTKAMARDLPERRTARLAEWCLFVHQSSPRARKDTCPACLVSYAGRDRCDLPAGPCFASRSLWCLAQSESGASAARACAGTRSTSTCSATGSFSTSWSVRAPVLHETPEEEIGSRLTRHNASSRVSIC